MPPLPTFVVIGAMRAGTTSLHAYLGAHPQVFVSAQKELDFFIAERNWPRGAEWYASQFAGAGDAPAIGEVSPNHTKRHLFAGVPERMAALLPDVRLIYVLRDPIDRMRSHYLHHMSMYGGRGSMGEALLEGDNARLCSCYAFQLECFLERFPRRRILVLDAEDVRGRRAEQLARVFEFLKVDPGFRPPDIDAELHRAADMRIPRSALRGRPALRARLDELASRKRTRVVRALASRPPRRDEVQLAPDVEAELRARVRPDVERLAKLLGSDARGWTSGYLA